MIFIIIISLKQSIQTLQQIFLQLQIYQTKHYILTFKSARKFNFEVQNGICQEYLVVATQIFLKNLRLNEAHSS